MKNLLMLINTYITVHAHSHKTFPSSLLKFYIVIVSCRQNSGLQKVKVRAKQVSK